MEEILKENTLLKQYIGTLEHQNQSRNRQRQILTLELDRLTKEVERLGRQQNKTSNSHFQQTNIQMKQRQQLIMEFNHDMLTINRKCNILQEQKNTLVKENTGLKAKGKQIQDKLIETLIQNNKLLEQVQIHEKTLKQLSLKTQTSKPIMEEDMQKKIIEYQQIIKSLNAKIQDNICQINKQKDQITYGKVENMDRLKNDLHLKEIKCQLNDLQYQYGKLQREKINLNNKVRQLDNQCIEKSALILKLEKETSLGETYQTSINIKQKEIKTLSTINQNIKQEIRQLLVLLKKKDNAISQIQKMVQDIQKDKDQQIRRLNQIIKQKDKQIQRILNSFNSNSDQKQDSYNNNNNNYYQNDSQMQNLGASLRKVQGQRDNLQQESEHFKQLIYNLRNQNLVLKSSIERNQKNVNVINKSTYQTLSEAQRGDEGNFKSYHRPENFIHMINDLRGQLNQLRLSNSKITEENVKMRNTLKDYINRNLRIGNNQGYQNYPSENLSFLKQIQEKRLPRMINKCSEAELINREPYQEGSISPITILRNKSMVKSKDRNQQYRIQLKQNQFSSRAYHLKNKQKMILDKQKWQSLQRKINSLRQQNQGLKKTLFQ